MLTQTDYIVALDEIRKLVKQRLQPNSTGARRLRALAAAVAEYADAHRRTSEGWPRDPEHDRSRLENIGVLPISRARRDLASILRRQRVVVVTRRGIPVVVMTPLGQASSEVAK